MSLKPGDQLGTYEILAPLGAGGMGEVYRARDGKLLREVALKVLRTELAADAERLARFKREARMLAQLNHPNIATLFDLEDEGERRWIVMELVLGQTLSERLRGGPLTIRETLALARQLAEALESAHAKGVIHRDLKPSNLKITPEGRLKVLDFGLAKALETRDGVAEDSFQTASAAGQPVHKRTLLGTPAYMSPEQVDSRPADQRSDIWSFGCIVYEALSGTQPFCGELIINTLAAVMGKEPDWQALPTDTPIRLRSLVQRCLEKDPQGRPSDMRAIRRDLEDVARDLNLADGVIPPRPARGDLPPNETAASRRALEDSRTEPIEPRRAPEPDTMPLRPMVVERVQPRRVPLWLPMLMLCFALVAGGIYVFWPYFWPIDSVAALPFKTSDADAALAPFAERLAEQIAGQLAEQSKLHVTPPEMVARVTDLQSLSVAQAGTRLGVRGIVTGRVTLEDRGQLITVHAELHDARTQRLLWEQKFSRRNVFIGTDALGKWQAHVAKEIADKVAEQLGKFPFRAEKPTAE